MLHTASCVELKDPQTKGRLPLVGWDRTRNTPQKHNLTQQLTTADNRPAKHNTLHPGIQVR